MRKRKGNIYARAILLSLWRKADYYKTETFFCSDKQMAEDLGIHTDTVKRAKRFLAASGLIQYISGKFVGKATEYKILRRHDGSRKYFPLWKIKSPADSTPLESPAASRPNNIYDKDILLASARSEQNSSMNATASAFSPVEPQVKRLRSIEEIQREHPDAIKSPLAMEGHKWAASWRDPSKKSGYSFEPCL